MSIDGPVYFRLGKSGEPVLHQRQTLDFAIGRGIIMRDGEDVALVSTGNMLSTALEVRERLARSGISASVISMHTVKPIDRDLIAELSLRCRLMVTLEEHSLIGGLGGAVASVLTEDSLDIGLMKQALPDKYIHEAGSHRYILERVGLTPEKISSHIAGRLAGVKREI